MDNITFYPQGDQAITVMFGHEINEELHSKVMGLTQLLQHEPFLGMVEVVPSFHTVTIYYNPTMISPKTPSLSPYDEVVNIMKSKLKNSQKSIFRSERLKTIPICYGGEFGPDLKLVAEYNQLTEEEVIHLHLKQSYVVYMIGFIPGFPYLGGMTEQIATPRKATPRLKVPAGSVGIGGEQTGVYPIESPGGWQLIGRTPIKLFQYEKKTPSLLKAGDIVRFKQITVEQFENWDGV